MESPQAHLERAERCAVMARQLATDDAKLSAIWVMIGTLEQGIAFTQQRFGVALTDARPPVVEHVGNANPGGNVIALNPGD